MLRYIYGRDLHDHPLLRDSMFRHRTAQFRDRLGWDVNVDARGHETDDYDLLDPLYAIWAMPDGHHGGSMRFLPTTGPTMVNDHFAHVTGGKIRSPLIWECTRFCLAPDARGPIAAAMMLAGAEIMAAFGIGHFVGVFDARMIRVYHAIGASPHVLGNSGTGRSRISVGLWTDTKEGREQVRAAAGIAAAQSAAWFRQSFGGPLPTDAPSPVILDPVILDRASPVVALSA